MAVNKSLFILCGAFLMAACSFLSLEAAGINWKTNYDQAVAESKASSKPLVLFFTGSDWCGWCTKLDEEAFDTAEFADATRNKFIFVKLDYPLYSQQDSQLKAQNQQLKQRFNIRSYPTVILWDAQNNQQIGQTGYRPGGGKQYAAHLSQMLNDYSGYKQKVSTLHENKFSGDELKLLHEKAKELQLVNDANQIVQAGVKSDQSLYFLVERYHCLATKGQIHTEEAVAIRQQLFTLDPKNEKLTHYQIAVIDFETCSDEMERSNVPADLAVAPLAAYIEKFGANDKENLWRLQMIISQVYLDKNEMQSALNYAEKSYKAAPSSIQPKIAKAIKNIQVQSPPLKSHVVGKKFP